MIMMRIIDDCCFSSYIVDFVKTVRVGGHIQTPVSETPVPIAAVVDVVIAVDSVVVVGNYVGNVMTINYILCHCHFIIFDGTIHYKVLLHMINHYHFIIKFFLSFYLLY